MNELFKNTVTSMEVAEMMGKSHANLMRDIKRYTKQLGQINIEESDFFTESTYQNNQNKIQPCYQITKKGCEFIAHKLTGLKGTEFTVKYINRFYEMEQEIKDQKREEQAAEPVVTRVYELKSTSLGEIASYIKEIGRRMDKQGSQPYEICSVIKMVSEQFGVPLPTDFVKLPKNKMESIFDIVEENYYD